MEIIVLAVLTALALKGKPAKAQDTAVPMDTVESMGLGALASDIQTPQCMTPDRIRRDRRRN